MTKKLTALAVVLAPAVALGGDVQMSEGLWEISTSMDMPGLPFKLPPQTVTHCYTKEEIAKAESGVPEQQKNCKLADSKKVGNKLTWKVVCTGKNPGTGEGEIVFTNPTSYDGSMRMDSQGQVMTMKYSGKRTGNCK